jgi:hypothetical protein
MYIRNGSFVFTILAWLFASVRAIAGEYSGEAASNASGPRFGERGELAISGDTQLSLAHSWLSLPGGMVPQGSETTQLRVAPSANYFVLHGLSVGARVTYVYYYDGFAGMPGFNDLSMGPSIGYNVPLGEHFSFWPDVYVTWGGAWGGAGTPEQTLSIGGSAPLLYHPAAHFFLGLGPSFASTVVARFSTSQGPVDSARPSEVGVAATLGGWLAL